MRRECDWIPDEINDIDRRIVVITAIFAIFIPMVVFGMWSLMWIDTHIRLHIDEDHSNDYR